MGSFVIKQLLGAARSRREVSSDVSGTVNLSVMVGDGAPADLVHAVKCTLVPRTVSCRFMVRGFGQSSGRPIVHAHSDAVMVLVGTDVAEAAKLYRAYRARCVPVYLLLDLSVGHLGAAVLLEMGVAGEDVVICDSGSVAEVLGRWLLDSLPGHTTSLGACLECCQNILALKIVGKAVRSNAVVGALTFLKAADMPAMMATEVDMVYRLAGTYGLSLGVERAPELVGVFLASMAWKRLAGFALSGLPLPAPLVKSAVAALGTFAVGGLECAHCRSLAGAEEMKGEGR